MDSKRIWVRLAYMPDVPTWFWNLFARPSFKLRKQRVPVLNLIKIFK